MNEKDLVSLSKLLSFVLRHNPDEVGLALEGGGWVDVDDLLAALAGRGRSHTRADLKRAAQLGGKGRFSFDESGERFRANYGHSLPVQLELTPQEPPIRLYHGTARRFVQQIERQGLRPQGRQYVHLSAQSSAAQAVGQRHGRPVVLVVRAGELQRQG